VAPGKLAKVLVVSCYLATYGAFVLPRQQQRSLVVTVNPAAADRGAGHRVCKGAEGMRMELQGWAGRTEIGWERRGDS